MIWVLTTVCAAALQTARNITQRKLLDEIGAAGAAYVRFIYGAPFAVFGLAVVCAVLGETPVSLGVRALALIIAGGVAQIAATVLMLAAMRRRSFFATIALTKTEPLQIVVFALALGGERPGAIQALSVCLATVGVTLLSFAPLPARAASEPLAARAGAVAMGLLAASGFALSALAFRAAILAAGPGSIANRACTVLAATLAIQAALIVGLAAVADRRLLRAIAAEWRRSLPPGFAGALASMFWFLSFALRSAADVRTLDLIEVLFARLASRRLFGEGSAASELVGATLLVAGLVILLNTQ